MKIDSRVIPLDPRGFFAYERSKLFHVKVNIWSRFLGYILTLPWTCDTLTSPAQILITNARFIDEMQSSQALVDKKRIQKPRQFRQSSVGN